MLPRGTSSARRAPAARPHAALAPIRVLRQSSWRRGRSGSDPGRAAGARCRPWPRSCTRSRRGYARAACLRAAPGRGGRRAKREARCKAYHARGAVRDRTRETERARRSARDRTREAERARQSAQGTRGSSLGRRGGAAGLSWNCIQERPIANEMNEAAQGWAGGSARCCAPHRCAAARRTPRRSACTWARRAPSQH